MNKLHFRLDDKLASIEKNISTDYLKSICELKLQYTRHRQKPEDRTKLQMWINSTFQKDAFAWAMVRAKCVRQPASQSDIIAMTKISRQSISEMIKHCLAENWIEIFCDDHFIDKSRAKHCKGTLKYCAGFEMMKLAEGYAERHIQTTEDTLMNKNWDDLMAIRRVRGVIS
jgi:hypothetical protein